MPQVSVIIPVYNGEKTIRETIASVLNQTFTDFELIIINDGSADKTPEILENISDARIKIFSFPNAGLSTSRNRGIDRASGKYIAFIDADDLWKPDKLEAQYQALEANIEAAVAYSWTDYIDETGQFLRRGPHCNFSGNVYSKLLLADFIGSGSNPMIRTQVFSEVGKFNESLRYVEDWEMWLRLAARYSFIVVPFVQVFYRKYAYSMSYNVWGMEAASLQILEQAFAEAPESIQSLKATCLGNRYKGLTTMALEAKPERLRALKAASLFWKTISYDSSLVKTRTFYKVLLKITAMAVLPSSLAQACFTRFERVFNTTTLSGYARLDDR